MVPGVVAKGLPLGYHYDLLFPDVLVVTQLETGGKLPGALALEEYQVQYLIETLLAHYPWTQERIRHSPVTRLRALVEQAMKETGILEYI
jgi:hypothetical protein